MIDKLIHGKALPGGIAIIIILMTLQVVLPYTQSNISKEDVVEIKGALLLEAKSNEAIIRLLEKLTITFGIGTTTHSNQTFLLEEIRKDIDRYHKFVLPGVNNEGG
jgi:hypothetical protein